MEGTVTISLKDFLVIKNKAKLLDNNIRIVEDILDIKLPSGGMIKNLPQVIERKNKNSLS